MTKRRKRKALEIGTCNRVHNFIVKNAVTILIKEVVVARGKKSYSEIVPNATADNICNYFGC